MITSSPFCIKASQVVFVLKAYSGSLNCLAYGFKSFQIRSFASVDKGFHKRPINYHMFASIIMHHCVCYGEKKRGALQLVSELDLYNLI